MRAVLAPLGTQATGRAGAEALPKMQKPLLEQTAQDAGSRQPSLAEGPIPTSSGVTNETDSAEKGRNTAKTGGSKERTFESSFVMALPATL